MHIGSEPFPQKPGSVGSEPVPLSNNSTTSPFGDREDSVPQSGSHCTRPVGGTAEAMSRVPFTNPLCSANPETTHASSLSEADLSATEGPLVALIGSPD